MPRKKLFFRRTFGKIFNFWDLLLIGIVLASLIYVFFTDGLNGVLTEFARAIFSGLIIFYVIERIRRKARK